MQGGQDGRNVYEENVDFSIQIPKRLFRLSCNKIAQTASLASSTKIPMGALVRPLAPDAPNEDPVDVVQPGNEGIVRCKR
jgi:protein transport protein SEC24